MQCAHLEKYEFVNGKDDIPYMMEKKTFSKPPTRLILIDQWIIPSFPAKHQYDYGKFMKIPKMFETTSQIFASKSLIHKSRHGPTLLSQVSSMSRHAHANQQKERQGQRGQAFLGISCCSVRVARILF